MEEIKKKIVLAANELFMRYGIRSVSMDDIARHLGMSKKTIYQLFKDKDEIVLEVTKLHVKIQMDDFNGVQGHAKDSIDLLAQFSVCLRKSMKEINPTVLYDLQKYHRDSWEEWIKFKTGFIRSCISDMIKQGIAEGNFRKEADPEIMALLRMEQVQIAFDDSVYPRNEFNFTEVQMQLFDHFVYGLLTEEGRKLYEQYRNHIMTLEQTIV